jgi:putative hemolysin
VTAPFSLPLSSPWPECPAPAWSVLRLAAERVLGLSALNALYRQCAADDFIASALASLDITVDCQSQDLDRVPRQGPVIVVANHPSGALDGLALASVLGRVRSDVKLLGNHLLERIPEMRPWTIAVDPFLSGSARTRRGLRAARRWLENDGLLVVFPAGEVSSVPHPDGQLADRPWQSGVAHLVEWTRATVVPAFLDGRNSRLFAAAGRVHPRLRTALLPREFLRRRHSRQSVAIGTPVAAARVLALPGPDERLVYLRARTYGLRREAPKDGRLAWRTRNRRPRPIAPAEPPAALAVDIAALPASRRLLVHGDYEVYCAGADELPAVLREIGRLREITFRAAGEGTGLERDIDRFDESYRHLFVWHRPRREVIGAYRLGMTDRVCGAHGVERLYTRTLFHFGAHLLQQIGPAIELGRSFVRPEYQRESNALFLLWRGIGQVVAREPRYRRLFGPVSISAEYGSFTRHLLARFLTSGGFLSELAALVRARRPLHPEMEASLLVRTRVASDLDAVESLVKEIEAGRGIPVLLRHYLKLNARLLGFSVDPEFGNVLDGLVLVDLLDLKPAVRQRYLGRDGAAAFLAFHQPEREIDLRALPAAG